MLVTMDEKDEWQTFRPSMDEFSDLTRYIESLEEKGHHLVGIIKIVPPDEWQPRRAGYNLNEMNVEIETPLQQKLIPESDYKGVFRSSSKKLCSISPINYAKLAASKQFRTPVHTSFQHLEEKYWDSQIVCSTVDAVYGADVHTTLMDDDCEVWNVSKLKSILAEGAEGKDNNIPGVNDSYVYFGMWRATFSWHVEDMDLYATNYLHFGAPKTWYCVPPAEAYKLEALAGELYPDWKKICPNFVRHKVCMIAPKVLRSYGITVHKMVQEERNFIVVFPHAFHAGFNHGFNIAEAANFALPRWVEYGKRFRSCCCSHWLSAVDGQRLSMDYFVKKYQPDRYEKWAAGVDYGPHPEDPEPVKQIYSRLDRNDLTRGERSALVRRIKKLAIVLDLPPGICDLQQRQEEDDTTHSVEVFPPILDRSEYHTKALSVDVARHSVSEDKIQKLKLYRAKVGKENKPKMLKKLGFSIALEELKERRSMVKCKKKHRLRPCAKCDGCRQKDCKKCEMCMDMVKYGGSGRQRQKCVLRVCINPLMPMCSKCKWNLS